MKVTEYREKNPNCQYCINYSPFTAGGRCPATDKPMKKRTARTCPCYRAQKWHLDKEDPTE